MSGYGGGFAYFYDRLTENVPYEEMAARIAELTERFGGKRDGFAVRTAGGAGL